MQRRAVALHAASVRAPMPEERSDYPHHVQLGTRWNDNDVYGHVNNAEYYALFDTAINAYLIDAGGLDIHAGDSIGLCAESHCSFSAALSFPETVTVGLRVGKLGRTSVRYELGVFRDEPDELSATGWFVHVFVDRETRRPAPMPERLRGALEAIVVATHEPAA
ncbi:MAG: acyl-CoA thioester hydrolase [Thermoleophilaceae bacterium]|jgi:acyl-CoA thioester hydrolase|nr:acyl-CoA thioester hydrolase [Thermoleophilaceae bacterium]